MLSSAVFKLAAVAAESCPAVTKASTSGRSAAESATSGGSALLSMALLGGTQPGRKKLNTDGDRGGLWPSLLAGSDRSPMVQVSVLEVTRVGFVRQAADGWIGFLVPRNDRWAPHRRAGANLFGRTPFTVLYTVLRRRRGPTQHAARWRLAASLFGDAASHSLTLLPAPRRAAPRLAKAMRARSRSGARWRRWLAAHHRVHRPIADW